MTREEAIDLVIKVFDTLEGECNIEYDWSKEHNARDMAIEALEQDSILDKIRAEIMDFEEELFHRPNTDYSDYSAVRHCVEIIDKYKAGSEE